MDQHVTENQITVMGVAGDSQQENEEMPGGHSVPSPESGSKPDGEFQPPMALVPAKVNWGGPGKGLKVMARKPKMEESGVAKTEGKQRVPYLVEHEPQKIAFAHYFALGPGRSLSQVAQHFNRKLSLIQKWSSCYDWSGRIKALENRSVEEVFREKAIAILNLILDSIAQNDETGRLVLTSSERASVEKFKLAIDSFKHLRQDSREHEEHEKEMNSDGRSTSGRGRGGTMVNVIIQR